MKGSSSAVRHSRSSSSHGRILDYGLTYDYNDADPLICRNICCSSSSSSTAAASCWPCPAHHRTENLVNRACGETRQRSRRRHIFQTLDARDSHALAPEEESLAVLIGSPMAACLRV